VDVARTTRTDEAAETQLETFITRRHEKRVKSEGERREEELYAESVRAFNVARDQERRAEWATFHRQQAERHRATLTDLIQHHETTAERLEGKHNVGAA
jgi:hypothetical protein